MRDHTGVLRLASGSPRRIELLRLLGVPFEVAPASIDESAHASPASGKADAVARAGTPTLAADTELVVGDVRVGKPRDAGGAVTMLADLAACVTHEVRTEVVVVDAAGRRSAFAVRSRVRMRAAPLREIERYVATGEPLDKAGGYAIQGEGARLVAALDGCLANVAGLPLCHVYHALRAAGAVARERPERACQERFAFVCPVWRAAQHQGRNAFDGAELASWSSAVV